MLGLIVCKMLDCFQQLRVFLPHDPIKLRGPHPGVLHLLEGLSRIDTLMLAGVTDHQHPVIGFELVQKISHLLRAGETGFVQHVKMASLGFALGWFLHAQGSSVA